MNHIIMYKCHASSAFPARLDISNAIGGSVFIHVVWDDDSLSFTRPLIFVSGTYLRHLSLFKWYLCIWQFLLVGCTDITSSQFDHSARKLNYHKWPADDLGAVFFSWFSGFSGFSGRALMFWCIPQRWERCGCGSFSPFHWKALSLKPSDWPHIMLLSCHAAGHPARITQRSYASRTGAWPSWFSRLGGFEQFWPSFKRRHCVTQREDTVRSVRLYEKYEISNLISKWFVKMIQHSLYHQQFHWVFQCPLIKQTWIEFPCVFFGGVLCWCPLSRQLESARIWRSPMKTRPWRSLWNRPRPWMSCRSRWDVNGSWVAWLKTIFFKTTWLLGQDFAKVGEFWLFFMPKLALKSELWKLSEDEVVWVLNWAQDLRLPLPDFGDLTILKIVSCIFPWVQGEPICRSWKLESRLICRLRLFQDGWENNAKAHSQEGQLARKNTTDSSKISTCHVLSQVLSSNMSVFILVERIALTENEMIQKKHAHNIRIT